MLHISRTQAGLAHFVISSIVFSVLVSILLLFWYPTPYFSAAGGWQGLRLVAAVDVVLGPLLTLIVYNTTKSRKELSIDLGLIVLLQIAALGWGVKAVYEQRPVAVVFLDTSFYTVPALAITSQGLSLDALDAFGDERPVYVFAQRPDSGADLERFEKEVNDNLIPPHEQVWLYQPLNENFARVSRSSVNINEVMSLNPDMKIEIEALLAESATTLEDNFYIALTSRYRNIILVFNAQGQIFGTVSAPFKSGDV